MEDSEEVKVKCPACPRSYSPRYINAHKRKAHGLYLRKRKGRADLAVVTPDQVTPKPVPTRSRQFKIMPFVVLEDNDGGTWLAEKIR